MLLFNSRMKLFSGKLKSRWFRPFKVLLKLVHPEKGTFKVNGQRLKPYFGGQLGKYKFSTSLQPP